MSATRLRPEIQAFLTAMAGAIVLIVGMGYGRFAFTGILPLMIDEHRLTLHEGNLAASANYAGYLAGALMLARAKPVDSRWLCTGAVTMTLICLAAMALPGPAWLLILIRGVAGIFSAIALIAGSLWLLQHMQHHNGAPVLYSGVGIGIFLSAELIAASKSLGLTSTTAWLMCALTAALLFIIALPALDRSPVRLPGKARHSEENENSHHQAGTRGAAWVLLLIYGLAGFGYIITATYLPLFLTGALHQIDPVHIWAVFGLAAAPSCFLWHRLLLKVGYETAFIINLLVQALGVILPVAAPSVLLCLGSAFLVGITFMGTVTLALPQARRMAHLVKFNMIAAMTATYGIGQIAGPVVAGALYARTGAFAPSLSLAAFALFLACALVFLAAKKYRAPSA